MDAERPELDARLAERNAELYARLDATARGENPGLLAELRTGFAIFGDSQHLPDWLPGYCLLLYRHRVDHLDDLPDSERIAFLLDLSLLGEAVRTATTAHDPAFRPVNYEILANRWPHLHGHVHARFDWEPEEYRYDPVWRYPRPQPPQARRLSEQHDALRPAITDALHAATRRAYKDR